MEYLPLKPLKEDFKTRKVMTKIECMYNVQVHT